MNIAFATCERDKALSFINQASKLKQFADTPDNIGPLLDLIEQDIVRAQDPYMYGGQCAIIPGMNYNESRDRQAVMVAVAALKE